MKNLTAKQRCINCKYIGAQAHATGKRVDPEPVCRRYAPRTVSGTGTGYSGEMFPVVDPENDWCGEFTATEPEDEKRCRDCKHFDPGDYDREVWCKLKDNSFECLFSCPDWLQEDKC